MGLDTWQAHVEIILSVEFESIKMWNNSDVKSIFTSAPIKPSIYKRSIWFNCFSTWAKHLTISNQTRVYDFMIAAAPIKRMSLVFR